MLLPRILRLSNNNVTNFSCKFSILSVTRTNNIQSRLNPPSYLENSKCLYSQRLRSAGYNKDYQSEDGVPQHMRLIYKFAISKGYVYGAYGIVYGSLLIGLPAISLAVSGNLLATTSELVGALSILAAHGIGAYIVLTRIPIRIYHDETDKNFTMVTYDIKKPLKVKHITIPEKDVIMRRVNIPTMDIYSYVPKSLNKKFFIAKEQFANGVIYKKFMSDSDKY